MPLTSGSSFGHYVIDREIGRGGMGVVYLARDTALDRPVAVKALPEHLAEDPDRLARFEREARALAQLNHPNVAAIHGVETHEGRSYLVLEYVDGETLASRLERGAIPVQEALELAIEIAAGIEAAHEAGIVHRDLKPDNVKITPAGQVKVLDFGLAKVADAELSARSDADARTVTMRRSPTSPGLILGTAGYMSPEQARGRPVDHCTDVWSFGVILYEMLAGVGPFRGEDAADSIGAILHKEVDLAALPATTPHAVRRVVRRCLERTRSRRLRHIGDARLELEDALATDSDVPRGPLARRSGAMTWVAWIVTLAALAGLGWSLRPGRTGEAPALVRSSIVAPPGVVFFNVDLSPDGRRAAMLGGPAQFGRPGEMAVDRLYVRALAEETVTVVPKSEGVFHAAFSPDGRTLAFVTRGAGVTNVARLFRVPADGSSPPVELMIVPERLRATGSVWFAWTPSGDLAFLARSTDELVRIDPGTGRELSTVPVTSEREHLQLGSLVRPFGDAHVSVNTTGFYGRVYREDAAIIDVETGRLRVLMEDANAADLTPAGDLLFVRGESVYLTGFDRVRLEASGPFRLVQSGLATGQSWQHGACYLARTGTLAFVPGGLQGSARQIVMIDADGVETPWGDERRAFEDQITVSAAGDRLAVQITSPGGTYELWASEVETPRLRRLIATEGDTFGPVLTPDGSAVVFGRLSVSDAPAQSLHTVAFDGTGPVRQIHEGWGIHDWLEVAAVSPDNAWLLAVLRTEEENRLLRIDLNARAEPRVLLERSMIVSAALDFSGGLIAYVSDETGFPEAWIRTIDADGAIGPEVQATTRGAWTTRWSTAGDGAPRLHVIDFERREWVTSVTAGVDGRLVLGPPSLTGRAMDPGIEDVAIAQDGTLLAIRRPPGDLRPTRVELVQGWLHHVTDSER